MYRFPLIFLLLFVLNVTSAFAASKQIVVRWDNSNLLVTDRNSRLKVRKIDDPDLLKKPRIECEIDSKRTTCIKMYELKKNSDDKPYGINMRFVKPIAVFPEIDAKSNDSPSEIAYEERSQGAIISKLPEYKPNPPKAADVATRLLSHYSYLGLTTQSRIFSDVDATEGGSAALALWQDLLDKKPLSACDGSGRDDDGDSCTAIVRAKKDGNEAFAHCEFIQTKIGNSLPFNCETVAFNSNGHWQVLSYDGPARCGGCGAVDGSSCTFETKLPLAKVAEAVVDAFKGGKTNMSMGMVRTTPDKTVLAGKKIGADSRWKVGYYEKSSANYTVAQSAGGLTHIFGVYQLLVSSDPSKDENDNWMEFGDIRWFQDQILKVLKRDIVDKISSDKTTIECQNDFR